MATTKDKNGDTRDEEEGDRTPPTYSPYATADELEFKDQVRPDQLDKRQTRSPDATADEPEFKDQVRPQRQSRENNKDHPSDNEDSTEEDFGRLNLHVAIAEPALSLPEAIAEPAPSPSFLLRRSKSLSTAGVLIILIVGIVMAVIFGPWSKSDSDDGVPGTSF